MIAGYATNESFHRPGEIKIMTDKYIKTASWYFVLLCLCFIFSRPSFTRPASWLRGERGVPDRSRRLDWRPPSDPASSQGTLSSPPGGRRSSTASPRPAPPLLRRVEFAPAVSAAIGCRPWMVLLPPAV